MQQIANPLLRIGCFLRGAQPPYILLRGEKDLTYSDELETTRSRILGEELPVAQIDQPPRILRHKLRASERASKRAIEESEAR